MSQTFDNIKKIDRNWSTLSMLWAEGLAGISVKFKSVDYLIFLWVLYDNPAPTAL